VKDCQLTRQAVFGAADAGRGFCQVVCVLRFIVVILRRESRRVTPGGSCLTPARSR
jgi:hypothetical protein